MNETKLTIGFYRTKNGPELSMLSWMLADINLRSEISYLDQNLTPNSLAIKNVLFSEAETIINHVKAQYYYHIYPDANISVYVLFKNQMLQKEALQTKVVDLIDSDFSPRYGVHCLFKDQASLLNFMINLY